MIDQHVQMKSGLETSITRGTGRLPGNTILSYSSRCSTSGRHYVCHVPSRHIDHELISVFRCWWLLDHPGYSGVEESFRVSPEVATIGLVVYVFGLGVGPLLLAPLSEYFGRSPVYLVSWGIFVIFQIPLAVAPNIGTLLSCRFLQGFFGSAPLTNIGGVISDLFERDESGYAMAIYGFSSTGGPPFALVVSSYIPPTLGRRWLFWSYLIIFGSYEILLLPTLRETRHNIILEKRALKMRKQTGNQRVYDPAGKDRSLHHLFAISLTRPLHFLFTEPITLLSALYNGFVRILFKYSKFTTNNTSSTVSCTSSMKPYPSSLAMGDIILMEELPPFVHSASSWDH